MIQVSTSSNSINPPADTDAISVSLRGRVPNTERGRESKGERKREKERERVSKRSQVQVVREYI